MKKLSERQERMLSAYYDQELSGWGKFYVAYFLIKQSVAQEYLAGLQNLSNRLHESSPMPSESAWNALNQRLLDVEKENLYHGQMPILSPVTNFSKFSFSIPVVASVLICTFALGMFVRFGTFSSANQQHLAQPVVSPVISTQSSTTGPVSFVGTNPSLTVEMDWVKSDGRIRMIPAPRSSANIIWIKAPRRNLPLSPKP